MLSSFFSEHFESFAFWLLERRGSQFASHHILFYLPWIQKLDQFAEELDRLPTYTDIVSTFSVAETRQYLLITKYLDENDVIKIDKDAQKLHADLDMIDRYLKVFSKKSSFGKMILAYHAYLEEKHAAGKTSVRSMRLALTPAVRFFEYCAYGTEEKPSQELLKSYLWCFYGQKSAITGFTLFLNREFGYSFIIKNIYRPVLERPKASRKYLEHRFLFILRNKESLSENEYETFLRIAIGYLHRIDIPKHIMLGFCDVKKGGDGYQLRLAGEVLVLPEEVGFILGYRYRRNDIQIRST